MRAIGPKDKAKEAGKTLGQNYEPQGFVFRCFDPSLGSQECFSISFMDCDGFERKWAWDK